MNDWKHTGNKPFLRKKDHEMFDDGFEEWSEIWEMNRVCYISTPNDNYQQCDKQVFTWIMNIVYFILIYRKLNLFRWRHSLNPISINLEQKDTFYTRNSIWKVFSLTIYRIDYWFTKIIIHMNWTLFHLHWNEFSTWTELKVLGLSLDYNSNQSISWLFIVEMKQLIPRENCITV